MTHLLEDQTSLLAGPTGAASLQHLCGISDEVRGGTRETCSCRESSSLVNFDVEFEFESLEISPESETSAGARL